MPGAIAPFATPLHATASDADGIWIGVTNSAHEQV